MSEKVYTEDLEKAKNPFKSTKDQGKAGRIEVLLAWYFEPKLSYADLAQRLGVRSRNSIQNHVARLRADGLVVEEYDFLANRKARKWRRLTKLGETVCRYILAGINGESIYQRLCKKYFKGPDKPGIKEGIKHLTAIARELDEKYAENMLGAKRFDPIREKFYLQRKGSAAEVLAAARKYPNTWMAAGAVGMKRGAYEQRIEKFFAQAVERWEKSK